MVEVKDEWLDKGGDAVARYSCATDGDMSAEEYAEAVLEEVAPLIADEARREALEEAVKACDQAAYEWREAYKSSGFPMLDHFASAAECLSKNIRALIDKEKCVV